MSLINDALKEARQDAGGAQGRAGGPSGYQPPLRGNDGKGLMIALVVTGIVFCLILVGVGTVVYMLYATTAEHAESRRASEFAATSKPPTPTVAPPPTAPATEIVAPETIPPPPAAQTATPPVTPPRPAPLDTAVPPPPSDATPAVAPTPPPVGGPPPVEPLDAPAEIQREFDLKGIMKGRRGNMALINSRVARAGDTLRDGAAVVSITDSEVVLRVDGVDYRLDYTP